MPEPAYIYRAELLDVTDGDTVKLFIDQGLDEWRKARLRLAGLNAPEKYLATGKKAKAWVQEWFAQHDPHLVVVTEKDSQGDDREEKYGRFLVTIYSGEANLNADLIASGNAVPWNGQGPRPVPPA